MLKTGFTSIQIDSDMPLYLEDITSLTLANYGTTPMKVIVNDVARTIPAFNAEVGVPFGSFNLPGDGTACKVKIEVKFDGGIGKAILDYRKLIKNC
ncbi:hypothetical protein AMR72_16335 [Flavobacterium psychrophilum]|nr:hypothetical protein AMR72_16335 [Flavobacterium psychrophilum]AOE53933.1 hypothetical protein ALW18_16325 [Flavobacterium psychrophilum]